MMERIPAKTIITKTKSREWFGIDYHMNLYKGCCHGCIYCDSRSQCYGIQHFDKVRAKEDGLRIVRDELRRKTKKGVVGTGSMSDPYNPFEKEEYLTRHALELIDAFCFGTAIATKSPLIIRDIDILQSIMEHSPVLCKITITTWDDQLAKKIEPFVPPSSKRFEAIASLRDKGIFAGILLMPVLPFLEDTRENIEKIVRLAHESGAAFIYPAFGMTLRQNQREWYYMQLKKLFPEENLVQKYEKTYGERYTCTSKKAKFLSSLFLKECEKYHILFHMKDIIHAYQKNYQYKQIGLFDIS